MTDSDDFGGGELASPIATCGSLPIDKAGSLPPILIANTEEERVAIHERARRGEFQISWMSRPDKKERFLWKFGVRYPQPRQENLL